MKQLLFLIMLFASQVFQAQDYNYNTIKRGEEEQSIKTAVEFEALEEGGVVVSILTENNMKYIVKVYSYEKEDDTSNEYLFGIDTIRNKEYSVFFSKK